MAPGPLGGCLALASPTATSPRRKATFMVDDSVQISVDGRLNLILQAGLGNLLYGFRWRLALISKLN